MTPNDLAALAPGTCAPTGFSAPLVAPSATQDPEIVGGGGPAWVLGGGGCATRNAGRRDHRVELGGIEPPSTSP